MSQSRVIMCECVLRKLVGSHQPLNICYYANLQTLYIFKYKMLSIDFILNNHQLLYISFDTTYSTLISHSTKFQTHCLFLHIRYGLKLTVNMTVFLRNCIYLFLFLKAISVH